MRNPGRAKAEAWDDKLFIWFSDDAIPMTSGETVPVPSPSPFAFWGDHRGVNSLAARGNRCGVAWTEHQRSPCLNFSIMYSQVRKVNAMIEIVLVLSVAKGKILASQT